METFVNASVTQTYSELLCNCVFPSHHFLVKSCSKYIINSTFNN